MTLTESPWINRFCQLPSYSYQLYSASRGRLLKSPKSGAGSSERSCSTKAEGWIFSVM